MMTYGHYVAPTTTTSWGIVGKPGVWVAHFADWSGFVFFPTELEALRHAVEWSMQVTHVAWGVDPHVAADA
jgi:hypothetical protein